MIPGRAGETRGMAGFPGPDGQANRRTDGDMADIRARSTRSLVLLLLAAGCGGMSKGRTPVPAQTPGGEAIDYDALYRARRDSARMNFTEADVRFMIGMIAHHAQALVMSDLAPSHNAGPAVLRLTARIMNAQMGEIAIMQTWLRDRGQVVPEVEYYGIHLTVRGAESMMHMPGMLSDTQLEELNAARGVDFDRLFLKYMIQHHQGAVTMVEDLFNTYGSGRDEAAFKLASDIQVDQRTEIARMGLMLSGMAASGRTP